MMPGVRITYKHHTLGLNFINAHYIYAQPNTQVQENIVNQK